MKRWMKIGLWALGALVALVAVGATAIAAAGGPEGLHHRMMKQRILAHLDEALDAAKVTPEQRAALHADRDRALAVFEQGGRDHHAELERALGLFEADRIDEWQVKALRAERRAEMDRRGDAIVQALVDAHRVLQPAQRRAIADWVKEHHPAGHGERHHGFMKQMITARTDEALDAAKATAEQRNAIHAALDHAFATVEAGFEDRGAGLDRALALFAEDRIDDARVAALRDEHRAKMDKMGDAVVEGLREIHDVLTVPQRRAVVAWARAQGARWHHGAPVESQPHPGGHG